MYCEKILYLKNVFNIMFFKIYNSQCVICNFKLRKIHRYTEQLLIVKLSRKTFRRLLLQHTYRIEGGKNGRGMEWSERRPGESGKEGRRVGERKRYGEEEKDGRGREGCTADVYT